MTDMWMVRAGKNAILIDEFEKLNIVAIGWGLGDLTNKNPDEIKELVYNNFPDNTNQRNGKIAANETKFRHDIKEGDYVLSYNNWTHHYLLGKIASDYYYDPSVVNEEYSDVRDVEWLCKIPKADLKQSTQNSLGSLLTIFYIDGDAKEDILNVFKATCNPLGKSAGIIRKYLDENNLGNLKQETLEEKYDKFREEFGPDVLEKLEGIEVINKIFLHDSDKYTLCYNLEFSQGIGGGIGGGSAYKYSLFKSNKTQEWMYGSSQNHNALSESEAIEVAIEIRDALVSGAKHIENVDLDSIKDFNHLEEELNEIFSSCIVKATASWVHKYFVLLFPDKFIEIHAPGMKKDYLHKFHIEPENGYYEMDGQFYQLARESGIKLYSLLDDRILNLFSEIDEPVPIDPEPFICHLKRNIIYFGAPGTSKSYNLNLDKNELLENYDNNYERVTFHPDYSYANFVGTYKPVPDGDSITYKYVPGPFMRILKKAINSPSEPYLLIIEEINRANVAAVFGDVFQLLDRTEDYESEYPIEASEDMKTYLNKTKITLPSNLFIWATMNSADQGVFPMDTAFKRRWDFKYFSINHNENEIENTRVIINEKELNWNDLRKQINAELLSYKLNEDKLLGPFFAFNEFMNEEIDLTIFKDIFKNKIIMYLFEDAARSRRNELFRGACNINDTKNITYSEICELIDDDKIIEIFTDSIQDTFLDDEE